MTWPAGGFDTTSLDAGTDSPATSRGAVLLPVAQQLDEVINSRGEAGGVASLYDAGQGTDEPGGGAGKVPFAQLPATLAWLAGTGAVTVAQLLAALGLDQMNPRVCVPFLFPGVIVVTNEDNPSGHRAVWTNNTGRVAYLKSINFTGAQLLDTGTADTVLRATCGAVYTDVTLDQALDTDAYVLDSPIEIAHGDSIELTCESAGAAHQNVHGHLELTLALTA